MPASRASTVVVAAGASRSAARRRWAFACGLRSRDRGDDETGATAGTLVVVGVAATEGGAVAASHFRMDICPVATATGTGTGAARGARWSAATYRARMLSGDSSSRRPGVAPLCSSVGICVLAVPRAPSRAVGEGQRGHPAFRARRTGPGPSSGAARVVHRSRAVGHLSSLRRRAPTRRRARAPRGASSRSPWRPRASSRSGRRGRRRGSASPRP